MNFGCSLLILVGGCFWPGLLLASEEKPNIVVIITDDQGYADISHNPAHKKEVSTPHMDALAAEGIFFKNGYISGNVCSPTRLGLMLGRYQQRHGVYTAGEGGTGIDPAVPIFPAFLKPAGYTCGAFGKWHLGIDPEHNPVKRGFDYFYGFMGRGAHSYLKLDEDIYRNDAPIQDGGYLTQRLSEEASEFIKRSKDGPFFVYLAYNAVHSPQEAPPEDIERFKKEFPDLTEGRAILMAMLHHLDEGVGRVVKTLKDEGEWKNTLLFFLTDNGGAPNMEADCTPLRGHKHENYEGGIRTPFIVTWPAKIKGGQTRDVPVISLDILPTALEAAGAALPEGAPPFDGRSILPVIDGTKETLHDALFWSEGGSNGCWAVRDAEGWKAVTTVERKSGQPKTELFHLVEDPAEERDLSGQNPEKVKQLTARYDAWLDRMSDHLRGESKRWDPAKTGDGKKDKREKKEKKQKKGVDE